MFRRTRDRSAFTLIELLTVIVIIGILVGMITAAVIMARTRARVARIATEINNLDLALKNYQERYGDAPPDGCGITSSNAAFRAMVVAHFAKAFPRYVPGALRNDRTADAWTRLRNDCQVYTSQAGGTGLNLNYLDPATAMVFFLGGVHIANPSNPDKKLLGFAADPSNPFNPRSARLPVLFEFDPARLVPYPSATSGFLYTYQPDTGTPPPAGSLYSPYLYFRARASAYNPLSGTSSAAYDPTIQIWTAPGKGSGMEEDAGVPNAILFARVRPYYNSATRDWCNPASFQIISAGLDGLYGGILEDMRQGVTGRSTLPLAPHFPAWDNMTGAGHFDNQTNFSTRGTLEDAAK